MNISRISVAVAGSAIAFGFALAPAATGASAMPYLWKNCTQVHTNACEQH